VIGWAFSVSGETPKRFNHPSPVRFARELWMAGKKGERTMANQTNGNQFRDDEIIRLRQAGPPRAGL